jgi:hypothetical protein
MTPRGKRTSTKRINLYLETSEEFYLFQRQGGSAQASGTFYMYGTERLVAAVVAVRQYYPKTDDADYSFSLTTTTDTTYTPASTH